MHDLLATLRHVVRAAGLTGVKDPSRMLAYPSTATPTPTGKGTPLMLDKNKHPTAYAGAQVSNAAHEGALSMMLHQMKGSYGVYSSVNSN